jgi:hypothetical protein
MRRSKTAHSITGSARIFDKDLEAALTQPERSRSFLTFIWVETPPSP